MQNLSYNSFFTRFGEISILWSGTKEDPLVERIILPNEQKNIEVILREEQAILSMESCETIDTLSRNIQRFLDGEDVELDTSILNLDKLSEFQRNVLVKESEVPRGMVTTYGILAKEVGREKAAVAVGNALAGNPFPIVIPCHRTVRSTGELSEYKGGLKMKFQMLKNEEIKFDNEHVSSECIYSFE